MKKLILPTLVLLLASCSESSALESNNTEPKPSSIENLNIQMNSFTEVDDTGIFMFPLKMGQNHNERGIYDYKEMPYYAYWNIIFLDSNTGNYHLLTEQKIIIQDFTQKYEHETGVNIPKNSKYIFYNVRNSDYNKDKLLNEKDPVSLFVSDKLGKNFRQISPTNTNVENWKYIQASNKVIMTARKDSDKNNLFDGNDEVLTYEITLEKAEKPKEVFKPELIDKLKKLYDRDWKKIKK